MWNSRISKALYKYRDYKKSEKENKKNAVIVGS